MLIMFWTFATSLVLTSYATGLGSHPPQGSVGKRVPLGGDWICRGLVDRRRSSGSDKREREALPLWRRARALTAHVPPPHFGKTREGHGLSPADEHAPGLNRGPCQICDRHVAVNVPRERAPETRRWLDRR